MPATKIMEAHSTFSTNNEKGTQPLFVDHDSLWLIENVTPRDDLLCLRAIFV